MQITTANWEIDIKSFSYLQMSDERLVEMLKYLNDLRAAANMEDFSYIKRPDGKFDYQFKSFDGREWNQVIDPTDHADYKMTFDTQDEWKLSEFVSHRPLRDHAVKLTHDFQLEWIKVRFIAQNVQLG